MHAPDNEIYDVCIIGAGVVGCALARELSKYRNSVVVLERGSDIGVGATKANSGIVHGGYAAKAGTLKAKLCRRGNRMYRLLEDQLSIGYRETGSLVLAFDREDLRTLRFIQENGEKNGLSDLAILSESETRSMEPSLAPEVRGALYCPSAGVVSPYEMAIALAENAADNGVRFLLDSAVTAISVRPNETGFTLTFGDGDSSSSVVSRYVVNAAGVYADRIAAMALGDTPAGGTFSIIPRQGQYIVFERGYGDMISNVLFQPPTIAGKGILVAPTYHRNLLIGPNADEVPRRDDVSTTQEILRYVIDTARRTVPDIDIGKAITTYAGIRATSSTGDFVIGESGLHGFINAAGIDSPGLTSSPAIAEELRDELAGQGLDLQPDPAFDPHRRAIVVRKNLSDDETEKRILDDGPSGIACRCERVSWSEIEDALGRPVCPPTIDAVKRRTRAGMGRCQGAFCAKRVAAKIEELRGIPVEQSLDRSEREKQSKNRIKTALLQIKGNQDG